MLTHAKLFSGNSLEGISVNGVPEGFFSDSKAETWMGEHIFSGQNDQRAPTDPAVYLVKNTRKVTLVKQPVFWTKRIAPHIGGSNKWRQVSRNIAQMTGKDAGFQTASCLRPLARRRART